MNAILSYLDAHFERVSPKDFYRCIFPVGELDVDGAFTHGKYTGIVVAVSNERKDNGKPKIRRFTLTDELNVIDRVIASEDFCLCSPLSYAGKRRTAENARKLYAIAVDVDRIRMKPDSRTGEPAGMRDLWHQVEMAKFLPCPTFIVSSGTGVHLYYVLTVPVQLFRDEVYELQTLKHELTRKIWNQYIVNISSEHDIQQEGIYQGFRMPGTVTKSGDRAVAYRTGERVTLDYLNGFVVDTDRAKKSAAKTRTHVSMETAKEKYPEWYESRIVRGEKGERWHTSRRVYDWWKEKIRNGATVGHRYYCLMMLAVYAQKCSYYDAKHNPTPVTREELERDCFELMELMEKLTNDKNNHFGRDDVLDALEAFDERWTRYPRAAIEYKSGIAIEKNKRNGRKQKDHIRLMNLIREELNGNKEWHGRKSKSEVVQKWRKEHPEGKKIDCIRETGLSKPTVYKHWNAELK